MQSLVDLIYTPLADWQESARLAFAGALPARYQRVSPDDLSEAAATTNNRFQLRVNASTGERDVPFAALIAPRQERSGPYGGMSFVLFPSKEAGQPALIGMVVGTNGLAPDEDVLGRPGHARKVRAITAWLRSRGAPFAWAKQDPVRIDLRLPRTVEPRLEHWDQAAERYGHVLYGLVVPPEERGQNDAVVEDALKAFLDLFFEERRIGVMAAARQDSERIRRSWMATTLPTTSDDDVCGLLARRKYVVLEGPPGTGKTEMATRILREKYAGRGRIIQFHPGTTYESFIGGLAPEQGGSMGFTLAPRAGHLMEAARAASASNEPYLLVIDEVNRADLAKVLGEAIYLFEPGHHDRAVAMAHDFPDTGNELRLPTNLHVLGTMNSADRSIAILDLAVRRRFAFVPLWPQLSVVEAAGGTRMAQAFHELLSIFLDHATDDAFALMPGHAYFLADDANASTRLKTEVAPLLREYLTQGYVAPFADEVQAWLNALADSPV